MPLLLQIGHYSSTKKSRGNLLSTPNRKKLRTMQFLLSATLVAAKSPDLNKVDYFTDIKVFQLLFPQS
jgi:hypothetical protein